VFGGEEQPVSMNLFIEQLEATVEVLPEGLLKPETDFQKLEEWSSICSLMTLAMVYSEFEVQLSGGELTACNTVESLYGLVQQKVSERSAVAV
jgi:acyl carrier protein